MHSACMIVGPNPDQQLEPLSEHLQVPRYKLYLDAEMVELMADHFSLPATDLRALADRMPDWHESDGGIDDGRLFYWSTANPQAKYDWYEMGGRFRGYLRLKTPRPVAGWRRLFGARPIDRVDQALKRDILQEPLLAQPPAAVLFETRWHECPLTSDANEIEAWRHQFANIFATVPDEALLTVMDLHS